MARFDKMALPGGTEVRVNNLYSWADEPVTQRKFHETGHEHIFLDLINILTLEVALQELNEYKALPPLPEGMLYLFIDLESTTDFSSDFKEEEIEPVDFGNSQTKAFLTHGQRFDKGPYLKEYPAVYKNERYSNLTFLYLSAIEPHKNDPVYYRYLLVIHEADRPLISAFERTYKSSPNVIKDWFMRPISKEYVTNYGFDIADFDWLQLETFEETLMAYEKYVREEPLALSIFLSVDLKPTTDTQIVFTENELETWPYNWIGSIYAYANSNNNPIEDNSDILPAIYKGKSYPDLQFVFTRSLLSDSEGRYQRTLSVMSRIVDR